MADWHSTARAMKADGMSQAEIGRALGKDRRTVSEFFNQPACATCGGPRTRSGARITDQCASCHREARAAAKEARLEEIAQMWDRGMSQREIAVALGYGPNSSPPQLTELRRRGRIDYRYPGAAEHWAVAA